MDCLPLVKQGILHDPLDRKPELITLKNSAGAPYGYFDLLALLLASF
jgi:hypothetical protein